MTSFFRTHRRTVYHLFHSSQRDLLEDHIYDECRYVLMENPIAPRANVQKIPPAEDPLDLWAEEKARFLRI